jgi:hypothetical protein
MASHLVSAQDVHDRTPHAIVGLSSTPLSRTDQAECKCGMPILSFSDFIETSRTTPQHDRTTKLAHCRLHWLGNIFIVTAKIAKLVAQAALLFLTCYSILEHPRPACPISLLYQSLSPTPIALSTHTNYCYQAPRPHLRRFNRPRSCSHTHKS